MPKKNSGIATHAKRALLSPTPLQIPGIASPVFSLGDAAILQTRKLAFFCSVKCPGEPILQAYDFARVARDEGITVIGGFQSPVEKDCLDILLKGAQPVIVCPARSLHNIRLPLVWKTAIGQGRLLLLPPFAEGVRRPTIGVSEKRNEFVATLADAILFAYAHPGGKTEALAKRLLNAGKPMFTFDSECNSELLTIGAKKYDRREIGC